MTVESDLKEKLDELGLPEAKIDDPVLRGMTESIMQSVIAASRSGDVLGTLKALRDGIDKIIERVESVKKT